MRTQVSVSIQNQSARVNQALTMRSKSDQDLSVIPSLRILNSIATQVFEKIFFLHMLTFRIRLNYMYTFERCPFSEQVSDFIFIY